MVVWLPITRLYSALNCCHDPVLGNAIKAERKTRDGGGAGDISHNRAGERVHVPADRGTIGTEEHSEQGVGAEVVPLELRDSGLKQCEVDEVAAIKGQLVEWMDFST
jgi:hypothetical protein